MHHRTCLLFIGFAFAALSSSLGKAIPAGIFDLPTQIDTTHRIGDLTKHPWTNPNVDGLRIRVGWKSIEPDYGVYDLSVIQECLANAYATGKKIGLGVISGIGAPDWLISMGVETRQLTLPDTGLMVTPWDPLFKTEFKKCIALLGGSFDEDPNVGYVIMSGFQQTGECYLASAQPDIDFFDASAIAHGYVASNGLPAGLVAWQATVKEMVDAFMTSFPLTPLYITLARPYGYLHAKESAQAMNEIVAWGIATYPSRFGLMNSQLQVTSTTGSFVNSPVYNNSVSEPVGLQFLCSTGTESNVERLSGCGVWGSHRCLSAYDAFDSSMAAGVVILGKGFIETYEWDVKREPFQSLLGAYRAQLLQ
jgi:hypothetical protein